MAQTLERLIRRTDTMQNIRGIVSTMKTMSAINAAPYEQAAQAIDDWRETIIVGLHAFLYRDGPLVLDRPHVDRKILIVMGSDHGLCGNYNESLAIETKRHLALDSAHIICVGALMEDALDGEGLIPEATLLPPANVGGLNRLAGELVTRLERYRTESESEVISVKLVYMQRGILGRQGPVMKDLLPMDAELLDELAKKPWRSRSVPQFSLPASEILSALIRNLLFATLYRAAAEALVTENAARLARMQQAEQAVDENLESVRAETRAVRQSEITTELLDVIVGFEALKAKRHHKDHDEMTDD